MSKRAIQELVKPAVRQHASALAKGAALMEVVPEE